MTCRPLPWARGAYAVMFHPLNGVVELVASVSVKVEVWSSPLRVTADEVTVVGVTEESVNVAPAVAASRAGEEDGRDECEWAPHRFGLTARWRSRR